MNNNDEMLNYIEHLKSIYTNKEIKVFLHGYIFARACEIKKNDENYKDLCIESIMEIIFNLLMNSLEEEEKEKENEKTIEYNNDLLYIDINKQNTLCYYCDNESFVKINDNHCYCSECKTQYEIKLN